MKKLLLIFFCFFSLNTFTYASFPITESPSKQLSESKTDALVIDVFSINLVSFPFIKSNSVKRLDFLKINWSELHWALKALLILISLAVIIYVVGFTIIIIGFIQFINSY